MSQRRADDRPCDLILALRFAIMAGLRRIHKTEILPYNGTFLSLLGLPHIPDQTTDSSSVSAPKSYANGSPCTIGFGLNVPLGPDDEPPLPSISIPACGPSPAGNNWLGWATTPRNGADVPTTRFEAHRQELACLLASGHPWGQIPTDDWAANVACFPLLLFAYNLVHRFQRLCLPRGYLFATLDTIRTDFLVLPAKPVKSGSQTLLVLPQGYHHEAEFKAPPC